MTTYLTATRSLLLAGAMLSVLGLDAHAQQPPASPAAPAAAPTLPAGSPLIGRPDNANAAKLAPVSSPPIPTSADKLPTAKLKLPPGFNVEVYASGMANAREMREGDKGTVFVGSRLVDKVYAIRNKDGKRDVKVIASGLYRPNGVAFHNGTLFIAELSKISKIDNIEDQLDNPPKPTTIYDDLPKDEAHGWKFISIGPDNKLYVPVGQPGNNVLHDKDHGQIRRMNLDGSGVEIVALGVRNTVGFDWNPINKQLYFTDNGRDWMSETVPEDELNRVTKVGEDFGAPYCYQGQHRRSGIRLGSLLQRVHAAGDPDGTAFRLSRHALLYRRDVPQGLQGRDLRLAPRIVEQDRQGRRRYRGGETEQGRHREIG